MFDFHQKLAKCLSDTALPTEESAAREVMIDPNHMMNPAFRKCSKLVKTNKDGKLMCPCCPFSLKNENWMLSHVAMKPHNLAKDYVTLKEVEKLRNLWCKLCSKRFSTKKELEMHLAENHYMDDIILETRQHGSLLSGAESPKYLCNDCPIKGYKSHSEMIKHRTEEHDAAFQFYRQTQVTFRELKCKLQACKNGGNFSNLTAFKRHLGEHFKNEMHQATQIVGPSVICLLCHNSLHQVGNPYDLAGHVAVRHNYLDQIYLEEVKRESQMEHVNKYACALCGYDFPTLDRFLQHITAAYCTNYLNNVIFRHGSHITCHRCHQRLNFRDFQQHAGMSQTDCNLSLSIFFAILDKAERNISWLSFRQNLNRLEQMNKERFPPRKEITLTAYRSRCLQMPGKDFVEDPVSCEVDFDIDIKENIVTTVFRSR